VVRSPATIHSFSRDQGRSICQRNQTAADSPRRGQSFRKGIDIDHRIENKDKSPSTLWKAGSGAIPRSMFPACVGGRCCRLHWPSSTASRSRLLRFYEKPEDWQSAHAMTQLYRSLPGCSTSRSCGRSFEVRQLSSNSTRSCTLGNKRTVFPLDICDAERPAFFAVCPGGTVKLTEAIRDLSALDAEGTICVHEGGTPMNVQVDLPLLGSTPPIERRGGRFVVRVTARNCASSCKLAPMSFYLPRCQGHRLAVEWPRIAEGSAGSQPGGVLKLQQVKNVNSNNPICRRRRRATQWGRTWKM
jgi:hypothetical protein